MPTSSAQPRTGIESCLQSTAFLLLFLFGLVLPVPTNAGVFEWQQWWNGGFIDGAAGVSANAAVVDPSGDLLVAGKASTGTGNKWLVARLDAQGNFVWWRLWPETGGGTPRAVALSGTGDLYVTGSSNGQCGLAKFSAAGDLLWDVRHSYAYTSGCFQLAVDSAGRPYVGSSEGSLQVVAYDVDGSFRWRGTILNVAPNPTDLEIVGDRVLVAGKTAHDSSSDLLIGAFDVANGDLEWETRWDRNGQEDEAHALAISGGKVLVAATTTDSSRDASVLSFDSDDGQFVQAYHHDSGGVDEATDIVTLGADVLVAGEVEGPSSPDLFLARLNRFLLEDWSVAPDLGGQEGALALALSSDESEVIVTTPGWISRYSVDGAFGWATDLGNGARGNVLGAVDDSVRVAGTVGTDMLLASVDDSGLVSWSTQEPYVQETREHLPNENAVAFREGLLYLAVGSYGLGPSVLAVQSDGSVVGNVIEALEPSAEFSAIAVEPGGTVYAVGFQRSAVTSDSEHDGTVYAFDAAGHLLWSDAYDLNEGSDVMTHVAMHPSGGIVALGVSEYAVGGGGPGDRPGAGMVKGSSEAVESVLVRYDANGNQLWRIDTLHGEWGGVGGLSVDAAGRVFVSAFGPEGGDESLCRVTAYDGAGSVLWQRVISEVADESEECSAQVLSDGSLVVAVLGHDFSTGGSMLRAFDVVAGGDAWSVPGDPSAPLDIRRMVPTTGGGVAASSRTQAGVVRVDGTGTVLWQVDAGMQTNEMRSVAYDSQTDDVILASEIGDRWISAAGQVIAGLPPQALDEVSSRWAVAPDGGIFRISVGERPGHSDDVLVSKLDGIDLFADGFESGDTSAWDSATP